MMEWTGISEEKKYTDTQGNKLTLHQMVCTEPMWAKNRLLALQKELEAVKAVCHDILKDHERSVVNWDAMKKLKKLLKEGE